MRELIRRKDNWLVRFLCSRWSPIPGQPNWLRLPYVVVEACRVEYDTTTWVRITLHNGAN
jgi:hypothetical protein